MWQAVLIGLVVGTAVYFGTEALRIFLINTLT